MSTSDQFKAEGNKAFSSGNFSEAIKQFTAGIEIDPQNHILYSNRSGAYCATKDYTSALVDAEKVISIKSDWPKGYSRKGAALHGLQRLEDAKAAYEQGLVVDPTNPQLKKSLAEINDLINANGVESPFDNLFKGDIISKIAANPKISSLLSQPDFMEKVVDIQNNPKNLSKYSEDPRIMNLMIALMGLDASSFKDTEEPPAKAGSTTPPKVSEPVFSQKQEEYQQFKTEYDSKMAELYKNSGEDEILSRAVHEEDTEGVKIRNESIEEKNLGNAAYKKKNFVEALSHYDRAIELVPTDITFYNNKSAVYFEMGDFEKCIEVAEKASEVGRENRSDFKLVAKSFLRIGSAYQKLDDLPSAIKYFNKSLTEHRTADCLSKLKAAEKELKKREEEAYLDDAKAQEARERGNEFFKTSKFPEAIKEYSEAIKRDPKDPRCYSNRAACYTKLMALPEALKDIDKCLELDPTFIKAYMRKAAIQFIKREYADCMETCSLASEIDTEQKHASEIQRQLNRCYSAIQEMNQSQSSEDALRRAQQDPEVQRIISDPGMQIILQQMQSDPRAIQEHLKNPTVARNLRKLMAAGIVRMA
ncbi:hypothetical protein BB559_005439 [Furculomyces boomerangus]|uniref:STI1 domain-containing protein n=2 Tax=Harpellales TaxID=61421 RepID=A0A2T9Y8N8_9FUNG|nr:hypothetical protein BB559_005439 [Furculomyces boomerangus]PWA01084.1 hypothetical protein BB558_002825 [Smittium angustum]